MGKLILVRDLMQTDYQYERVEQNCMPDEYACRRVQRQALLYWAHDSRSI